MAHNDEASGGGVLRSLQLSLDEADVLYWQRIPVSVQYKLPHGWHVSNAGFAVPPSPPAGPQTRALARERRNLPANALDNPAWARRFEDERAVELVRAAVRASGCFNNIGRRAWWHGRDVNDTLRQYGFRQRARGDPPRVPLYFPQPKSAEGAGKDCGVREFAHRIVSSRRPHALGRARAFFRRRRCGGSIPK